MTEQWIVGIRLKEARIDHGLSIRKAAEMIGVSEGWWRMLELGTKPLKGEWVPMQIPSGYLYRAALILDLDPNELIKLGGDRVKFDGLENKIQIIIEKLRTLAPENIEKLDAYIDGLRANQ